MWSRSSGSLRQQNCEVGYGSKARYLKKRKKRSGV
jgi:hypothetical protein